MSLSRLLDGPRWSRRREKLGDRWAVARSRLPFARTPLSLKNVGELKWWRGEVPKFLAWYRGELPELWGVAAPSDSDKVVRPNPLESAVLTFLLLRVDYYPERLGIPTTHFAGRKLLDVGCGALPFALEFVDCDVYGLDPLVDEYRAIGFPLDAYSSRMTYVKARAEQMPFADGCFDAVISVNAIDHVDDFARTAREVARVLAPEGLLRLEVHYHRPGVLEPHVLSDETMILHFGHLGLRKVAERVVPESQRVGQGPVGADPEMLTIWSNE
jgi:SAM-dependent methyltransferase